ncbi:MAG: DNA starvation/stationary phase protection protein [Bdellovibrionales bacterium]|nr:DNA starvation/stationary phase protection protein [Bdellovibrionales bacterium]
MEQNSPVKHEDFNISDLENQEEFTKNVTYNTLVENLNSLLANEFTLFTKTLNFHWNIYGPSFHSVHKFLDNQYHDLLKIIDGVAERIREIGSHPIGTLEEIKDSTNLVEHPGLQPNPLNMIADLMTDHETIDLQIREILHDLDNSLIEDPGTYDFLTKLIKKHEEMTWMLKSHLEK